MANPATLSFQQVLGDYWVGRRIGVGARTEVYEIKRRADGELFAAKWIPVRGDEDLKVIGHLENEYNVLTAIHAQPSVGVEVVVKAVEFKKVKKLFKAVAAYLIMERLEGRPLSDKRDYSLDQILTVFRQVCLGLEKTHAAGYVHADMKPQNILVGEHFDVKVIDFGFAAPVGTKLNGAKGTFGFFAPEQAGGILTERTDVFNLGAVLYWTLTGQGLPSLMPGKGQSAVFVPDAPINVTPPYQLNPSVPKEMSDMVMRCCAFNPHERPTVKMLKQYMHGLQLRLDYGTV